jgi:hypothetical protein
VVSDRPPPIDDDSRVIRFRPRRLLSRGIPREKAASKRSERASSPVADLAKYEGRKPDNYRHRMVMNAIGMSLAIVLILMGEWFANVISHH